MGYFSHDKAERDNNRVNGTAAEAKGKASNASGGAKTSANAVTTLGAGTLITGNVICEGSAQIFGRVVGDIEASQVVVGDGAEVEGNITAHDIAISGTFKGTIRGHHVRMKGAALVDGEVFSQSLTVEENVQFEGVSRRLEKPIELQSCAQAGAMKTASISVLRAGSGSGSLSASLSGPSI